MASVVGGASSPGVVAAVPVSVVSVPARVGSPAADAAPLAAPVGPASLRVGGDLGAAEVFAAPVSEHVAALVRSRFDVAAVPLVVRRAYDASGQRPAWDAAVAVAAPIAVPAGSADVGGVAAAAAGSTGSGPGLWLWLAALASISVFFCRVTSLPAVSRPVPFISLLERPG